MGGKNRTSAVEKNKAGRELGERVTIFKRMVGEDFTVYVTFEQRPEGRKTVNQADILGKNMVGRENNKFEVPAGVKVTKNNRSICGE